MLKAFAGTNFVTPYTSTMYLHHVLNKTGRGRAFSIRYTRCVLARDWMRVELAHHQTREVLSRKLPLSNKYAAAPRSFASAARRMRRDVLALAHGELSIAPCLAASSRPRSSFTSRASTCSPTPGCLGFRMLRVFRASLEVRVL